MITMAPSLGILCRCLRMQTVREAQQKDPKSFGVRCFFCFPNLIWSRSIDSFAEGQFSKELRACDASIQLSV